MNDDVGPMHNKWCTVVHFRWWMVDDGWTVHDNIMLLRCTALVVLLRVRDLRTFEVIMAAMWTTVSPESVIPEMETVESWTGGVLVIAMVSETVVSEVESVIARCATSFMFSLVVDSSMVHPTMVSLCESVEVSAFFSSVTSFSLAMFSVVGALCVLLFRSMVTFATMVTLVSTVRMSSVLVTFVIPTMADEITTCVFDL